MDRFVILVICKDGTFRSVNVAEKLNKDIEHYGMWVDEFIACGYSKEAKNFGRHYEQIMENKEKRIEGVIVLDKGVIREDPYFLDKFSVPVIIKHIEENENVEENIRKAVLELEDIMNVFEYCN